MATIGDVTLEMVVPAGHSIRRKADDSGWETFPPGDGAGVGSTILYSRVSGQNATTTALTATAVPGLTRALLPGSVYEFEAVLSVASSSTAGNGYGVNFSAAGATIEAQISGTLAAGTQKTLRFNAFNTLQTPFLVLAGNGGVIVKGIVATGANAGDLTVQHAKVVSGTSTVYINSFLKVVKIA